MADEKEPLYGKQTDCANRCFNGASCIKALFFGIRKGELIILTQLDLLYWIILDNSQNNTSANIDVKHLLTYIQSYESVVSHMKALIIGVISLPTRYSRLLRLRMQIQYSRNDKITKEQPGSTTDTWFNVIGKPRQLFCLRSVIVKGYSTDTPGYNEMKILWCKIAYLQFVGLLSKNCWWS